MIDIDIWEKIKEKLSQDSKINQEVYNSYISKASFIENKKNDYTLVVKSSLGARLVEKYLQNIGEIIKKITNQLPQIDITTIDKFKKKEKIIKEIEEKKSNDFEFSFEHFIHGPSNVLAFKAAHSIVEKPGEWSPLFIYGDSGLGKTHLLKAIVYEIENKKPDLKVKYISSEEFASQVVDALQKGLDSIETLKKDFISYDFLLIDDIQFLAKKEKTNEILFTIFNNFLENKKQLVFSSDKLPDNLNGFDVRLITRFNLGLTTPIKPLDFHTALYIVDNEFKLQGITQKIPEEVRSHIAKFYANDVRKIKGCIRKINFWIMTNENAVLDLDLLNEIFKDMPITNLGILNVKKIKEIVAEKYGIPFKTLDGKVRTSVIVNARHIAMYLTREILGHSLTAIGSEFGGRDHTTVMSGIQKVEKTILTDKNFKNQIEGLKNLVISK
ncbi:chromosomal replication initiator protein DnaA [Williamsoniiplasma lucivorax]|uniref:Chromosomal replication initiator protein DnaA n=1 Tax=Williamsoniiplasma lucivorax TaxID=209274 RepID=A0A2S5RF03_9MOLU|nr:chromosomal replication initiator protein DnaA [Williamsoniiplasma lucivorax]PPE05890.1 chromosomal replication initiator protein DnaA [Williamsoniiplasma lucivorax]